MTLSETCTIYVFATTDEHVCRCPQWPGEGLELAGAGIRGSCEPLNGRCRDPDAGPLWEQWALFNWEAEHRLALRA